MCRQFSWEKGGGLEGSEGSPCSVLKQSATNCVSFLTFTVPQLLLGRMLCNTAGILCSRDNFLRTPPLWSLFHILNRFAKKTAANFDFKYLGEFTSTDENSSGYSPGAWKMNKPTIKIKTRNLTN
jgi:hypothetical protein